MRKLIGMVGFLLFTAGRNWADTPPPVIESVTAQAQNAVSVDLTCILPTNGPAVEHGMLIARLYEYDARHLDRAAKEIAHVTLTGITHCPEMETILRFPCAGKTAECKEYYLTAVLYPDDMPGHAGVYYINGFLRVLERTTHQELSVKLTPVDPGSGPTN